MAIGEKRFSSIDREVAPRAEFQPLPEGTYVMELVAGARIKVREGDADAIPRVSCMFNLPETENEKTGKCRKYFHDFYLSLKPGSDGIAMPDRPGGIVEFAKMVGTPLDVGVLTKELSDGTEVEYINPKDIAAYLEDTAGATIKANIKIEKGDKNKGYSDKNKVRYFDTVTDSVAPTESATDAEVVEAETEEEWEQVAPIRRTAQKSVTAAPVKGKRLAR